MKLLNQYRIAWIAVPLLFLAVRSSGQCPQLFDFYGAPSSAPYWYSCTGSNFSFNLQSPDNWGAYTVDWGDGTPATSGATWTSPSVINHVYTAAVDTFVVTVTELGTGCIVQGVVVMEEATSASIQIPVGGLTQACAPQVMEFINSSTNVSETTVFTWDFGDGSPQLVFDHTNWNQVVSHLYEQGTVDCETVVSLYAENYCNTIQGGESQATFNPIRIWDLDDPGITASATLLCYPDTTVTFLNTTERNCLFQGNIYQRYEWWNFGDYWGLGQDSIIDWTPWPPTFPHTMHYPGIGTYTVELLDSNYCGIAGTTITIQIVPPPVAGIGVSNDTICVGSPVTFYQQSTGGMNLYEWNFGNGMGWIPTGSGNITYVFPAPGVYTVQTRVSITGSSSACNDVAEITVWVLPRPDVTVTADPLSGCDQLTVNFDATTSAVTAWNWNFGPLGSYSGQDPPLMNYTSPGTYTATLTVTGNNGCNNSDSETITVHDSPEAAFTVTNLCEGDTAHFVDMSSNAASEPIISWSWDFGDGQTSSEENPDHYYGSSGTYTITLTVTTVWCSDTFSTTVEVEERPVAVMGADPVSGCSPLTVAFSNASTSATGYLWNFGDGQTSPEITPTHTFYGLNGQDTDFVVTLTAFNDFGCSDTDTLVVTVLGSAVAAFADNNDVPGCSPFQAEFTNLSQNAIGYLWNFGDGSTSTAVHPSHLYTNESGFVQTYLVTLVAYGAGGCNDTITGPIIVYPLANFDFTLPVSEGCAPLTVTMPYISGAQVYFWNFGDGTTSTSAIPTHTFTNTTLDPIAYTVTLTATSPFGCVDTDSEVIIVEPGPIAQFTATPTAGCSPLTVELTNLSLQASTYQWNYGDGQSSAEGAAEHVHTFVNTTGTVMIYTVSLLASTPDGCSSVYTMPVEVYPSPVAQWNDPGPQCAPVDVYFDNTSTGATAWNWELSNGTIALTENPTLFFNNTSDTAQAYGVTLTVTSAQGCTDTMTDSLVIHPTPVVSFTINETAACEPAPMVFTNTSELATSFVWNYGDGTFSTTSAEQHVHVFQDPGNVMMGYTIVLTGTNEAGCSDEASLPFTLYPGVDAAFSVDTAECSPYPAQFVNQSVGATTYEWSFGDGGLSSAVNPTHTYVAPTEDLVFTASLAVSNQFGCQDTAYSPIHVLHNPVAVAMIDSIAGCYPKVVTFYNGSIGADSYLWVYGTGATSTTAAALHDVTYYNYTDQPVTYDVTLYAYAENGCSSSDQLQVEVSPEIEASFNVLGQGCTPLDVQFDNTSEGVMSSFWQFGDGETSNEYEPSHTYFNWTSEVQVFEVLLVVQNAFGCADSTTGQVTVFPEPVASFEVDPLVQTWPDATVMIDNTSQGSSSNTSWNLGDGTVLYTEEPGSHTYATWGEYTIELNVGNPSCGDMTYQEVIILPPPPVVDFLGPAQGCAPLTVQFTNLSEYAAISHWQFGDGGQANATDPVYTYWNPGTYTVTLTVTGYDGSTVQMVQEQIIEVYPSAIAAFTVTPNEVLVPSQPVYCLNLSQNATTYEWIFGDGSTSSEVNPIYYYAEEGIYDVTLVANNAWNCPDTMTVVSAVYASEGGMIDFPNAFTPDTQGANGGIYDPMGYDNNVFFPMHAGIAEYRLQIFNKWGELLFESTDVNKGWDGYYRNMLCKQDVYVWKVRARFVDGQSYEEAGDVTLIVR